MIAPPKVEDRWDTFERVSRTAVWLFVAAFFIALLLLIRANLFWKGGPIPLFMFVFTELTTAVAGLALLNVLGIWFPRLGLVRILAQLSDRHMKFVGIGAFLLVVFVIGAGVASALGII